MLYLQKASAIECLEKLGPGSGGREGPGLYLR